jgi:hypothetical protein
VEICRGGNNIDDKYVVLTVTEKNIGGPDHTLVFSTFDVDTSAACECEVRFGAIEAVFSDELLLSPTNRKGLVDALLPRMHFVGTDKLEFDGAVAVETSEVSEIKVNPAPDGGSETKAEAAKGSDTKANIVVSIDSLPVGGDVAVELHVKKSSGDWHLVSTTEVAVGQAKKGALEFTTVFSVDNAGKQELLFKLLTGGAVQGSATLELSPESNGDVFASIDKDDAATGAFFTFRINAAAAVSASEAEH